MSEYQYVAFRAIDAPVTEKNLEFMRKQSSRAEVTAWSFENEYHHGDFRGNAREMLRRGYDFHFHYASFGDRKLMIRLPNGLPDAKAGEAYFEKDAIWIVKDKEGPGGILIIEPFFEPGHLDDLWGLDSSFLDRLLPLRGEIQGGDLRPLYIARLAIASDSNHVPDEEKDAPVPAGLDKLTDAQIALAELYGFGKAQIAKAAWKATPPPERMDSDQLRGAWLEQQPEKTKTAWLAKLMADSASTVRSEILAAYQKSHPAPPWPTMLLQRTVSEALKKPKGS